MATETPVVTLETIAKSIEALRKDVRKIRAHLDDPTGEKAAARSANNGFNKLLDVTPELRSFLGLAADEKISRAAVTKRIGQYATEKGLKVGQLLNLDAPLKALLKVPEGKEVTFLNMQTYLKDHYISPPKPEKPPAKPKEPKAPKEEKPKEPKAPKEDRPKVAKKVAPAASA
jgi:hypothetical protein